MLVATGVSYRRLDLPRFRDFEGAGIYYAATEMEARLCRGDDVIVAGAGNSAGQAIVHLSRHARTVHVVVRGDDLGKSMSRYLVDRVEHIDNVVIHRGAVIVAVEGDSHLGAVRIRNGSGGEMHVATPALFMFIGADANTGWLDGCVDLDAKGFVLTGPQLPRETVDTPDGRPSDGRPFSSKRACRGSSRPAMSAAAPSSAAPRRSARARLP